MYEVRLDLYCLTYVLNNQPIGMKPRGSILITFDKAHCTILKQMLKLQIPTFNFWCVRAATEKETDTSFYYVHINKNTKINTDKNTSNHTNGWDFIDARFSLYIYIYISLF